MERACPAGRGIRPKFGVQDRPAAPERSTGACVPPVVGIGAEVVRPFGPVDDQFGQQTDVVQSDHSPCPMVGSLKLPSSDQHNAVRDWIVEPVNSIWDGMERADPVVRWRWLPAERQARRRKASSKVRHGRARGIAPGSRRRSRVEPNP